MSKKDYPSAIRKLRAKLNISQQELADMIGVSMHYISQIESAKPYKYFTVIIIGRIADALNIDIKDLFETQKEKTVI